MLCQVDYVYYCPICHSRLCLYYTQIIMSLACYQTTALYMLQNRHPSLRFCHLQAVLSSTSVPISNDSGISPTSVTSQTISLPSWSWPAKCDNSRQCHLSAFNTSILSPPSAIYLFCHLIPNILNFPIQVLFYRFPTQASLSFICVLACTVCKSVKLNGIIIVIIYLPFIHCFHLNCHT